MALGSAARHPRDVRTANRVERYSGHPLPIEAGRARIGRPPAFTTSAWHPAGVRSWHDACIGRRGMYHSSGLDLVVQRAALDPEFRARLLADPKHAIKDAFGVALPDTLRLRFIERGPDVDLLIVLPDLVASVMSRDDLSNVNGGSGSACWLFDLAERDLNF